MTYVFLNAGNLLFHGFLVGEHLAHLVKQVLHALEHRSLKICQVILARFLVKFILDTIHVLFMGTLEGI